jgi:hypothetical protein
MNQDVQYELEALRAIYGADFEDRPPVWNNPHFALRVRPMAAASPADIYCR